MDKLQACFWDEFLSEADINSSDLPIKRFACAMIIRAILDSRHQINGQVENNTNITRADVRSGIEWLMLSDKDEPLSFAWCCSVLNIQVEPTRARLRAIPLSDDIRRFFNY